MSRKITLTLADDLYEDLRQRAGSGDLTELIEDLLRSVVLQNAELEAGYREMAADTEREREALEWIEAVPDEALDK